MFQAPLEGIAVHSWHCLRAWLLQLVPKCLEKRITPVVSAVMLKPMCPVSYRGVTANIGQAVKNDMVYNYET